MSVARSKRAYLGPMKTNTTNKQDLPAHEAIKDWTIGKLVWERRGAITPTAIRVALGSSAKGLSDQDLAQMAADWSSHYFEHPNFFDEAYGWQPDWVARAKETEVSYPL